MVRIGLLEEPRNSRKNAGKNGKETPFSVNFGIQIVYFSFVISNEKFK